MNLAFSDEQKQLREWVRKFLEEHSGEQDVRKQMAQETALDPSIWERMASELGLLGLMIPESHGGAGLGTVELAVVMEEMGRALFCAPYFSTVILAATTIMESSDTHAKNDLLPKIAMGELLFALALEEEGSSRELGDIQATAEAAGSEFLISGVKTPVIDGHTADRLLVPARTETGLSIFIIDGNAQGLQRTSLPPLDPTRKLARIELDRVPGVLLGSEGEGEVVLERVMHLAAMALAAEQSEGAQACLDMSVKYAQERLQFGRPIGSFQAIKHKCADMLVQVESARSAAYYAAFSVVDNPDEIPVAVPMAKSKCSEAYYHVASETIQIHGGLGFTWEHPAHLYFKRAKSSALLFGDPAYYRQKLAAAIDV